VIVWTYLAGAPGRSVAHVDDRAQARAIATIELARRIALRTIDVVARVSVHRAAKILLAHVRARTSLRRKRARSRIDAGVLRAARIRIAQRRRAFVGRATAQEKREHNRAHCLQNSRNASLSPMRPSPRAVPRAEPLVRWRLILGASSDDALGGRCGMSAEDLAADAALGWLYDRPEEGDEERDLRSAGLEASALAVPKWLEQVHTLFPKETIDRLERDAVERYKIHEVVTNPEVLKRIEPSETLLRAVLLTKHLMNPEVLAMARELVAKVVRKLIEKLATRVRRAFHGTRARRRSLFRSARNFDAKGTLKENLGTWDTRTRRLRYIKRPLFFTRTRRRMDKWQVILLVDESGSMVGSVIHAAVTAACLWGLPAVKTHLCIFDTEVVDLTERCTDPVEILMKVQLGGGTDIGKAVAYAQQLEESPRRTIVVLITDFYEGGDANVLVRRVKMLCDQGSIVLGLAALDEEANPAYDKTLAQRLVEAGAHVGAMTPGELVNWIAEKVRA